MVLHKVFFHHNMGLDYLHGCRKKEKLKLWYEPACIDGDTHPYFKLF